MMKSDSRIFLGKFSFSQKWERRAQKGHRVFGFLCKIYSLVFARNDLNEPSYGWLAFCANPYSWENSRSRDLGQNGTKKGKNRVFWTFAEN